MEGRRSARRASKLTRCPVELAQPDYASIMSRLKNENADAEVIYYDVSETATADVVMQNGIDVGLSNAKNICVGNPAMRDAQSFWQAVPNGVGCLFQLVGLTSTQFNEQAKSLDQRARTALGHEARNYAFEAYDSVLLVVDAIRRAGNTDSKAIVRALEQTSLVGTQGKYAFTYTRRTRSRRTSRAGSGTSTPGRRSASRVHEEGQTSGEAPTVWPPNRQTQPGKAFTPHSLSAAHRQRSVPSRTWRNRARTAPLSSDEACSSSGSLAGPAWSSPAHLPARRYRERRADPRLAGLAGGLWGAALGAWRCRGSIAASRHSDGSPCPPPSVAAGRGARVALRPGTDDPVSRTRYVLDQIQTGLTVGLVYATMAVGLTLIYSVQRIVSFTHGQFVMFGGVTAFLLLRDSPWSPYAALPVVGLAALVLGVAVAAVLLRPVQAGTVERPDEYAILMTFGFGLFMTYALVGTLGAPVAVRTPRYTDTAVRPRHRGGRLGRLRFRIDRVACVIGLLIFCALSWCSTAPGSSAPGGLHGSHRVGRLSNRRGPGLRARVRYRHDARESPGRRCAHLQPEWRWRRTRHPLVRVVVLGLGSVKGALGGSSRHRGGAHRGCYPDPSRAQPPGGVGSPGLLGSAPMRPRGFFGRTGDQLTAGESAPVAGLPSVPPSCCCSDSPAAFVWLGPAAAGCRPTARCTRRASSGPCWRASPSSSRSGTLPSRGSPLCRGSLVARCRPRSPCWARSGWPSWWGDRGAWILGTVSVSWCSACGLPRPLHAASARSRGW